MDWDDELARDMEVRRADFPMIFAELKALCLGARKLGEDEARLLEELADAQARMIDEWNVGDMLALRLDAARASGAADEWAAAAPSTRRCSSATCSSAGSGQAATRAEPRPVGRLPVHARMPGEPTG